MLPTAFHVPNAWAARNPRGVQENLQFCAQLCCSPSRGGLQSTSLILTLSLESSSTLKAICSLHCLMSTNFMGNRRKDPANFAGPCSDSLLVLCYLFGSSVTCQSEVATGAPPGLWESLCHGAPGFLNPAVLSSCMATDRSRDIPLLPARLDLSWPAPPPQKNLGYQQVPAGEKKEEIRQHQAELM